MQLTDEVLEQIGGLLGVEVVRAAYSQAETPAYEFVIMNRGLQSPVRVVLWPTLDRVDAHLGDSATYFKSVSSVEFYPGVEVLFKREDPSGFLLISVEGRVVGSL